MLFVFNLCFFYFKIDFIDDKQERCRIDFNSMRELHGSDERRVRRVEADSSLPDVNFRKKARFLTKVFYIL